MAGRIHEQLDIETLSDLLTAAYDGRLGQVPGFGDRRVRAIREMLAGRLRRSPPVVRRQTRQPTDPPPVADLLDVDRAYREQAKAGKLPRLTPRRFNPTHEAWLPVLHTQRGNAHYTAIYSNTARAHEQEMTDDWAVIYAMIKMGMGSGRWSHPSMARSVANGWCVGVRKSARLITVNKLW